MAQVYNREQSVGIGNISNSPYFGTIYAPHAGVNFYGNGSIYGAVIGKTVSITGGGHVYYDQHLALAGSPGWSATAQANPAHMVTSIAPTSLVSGSPDNIVTINGELFRLP